jgi:hypothetical protein
VAGESESLLHTENRCSSMLYGEVEQQLPLEPISSLRKIRGGIRYQ